MMVSLRHAPGRCHSLPASTGPPPPGAEAPTPLGIVPHQVRGFVVRLHPSLRRFFSGRFSFTSPQQRVQLGKKIPFPPYANLQTNLRRRRLFPLKCPSAVLLRFALCGHYFAANFHQVLFAAPAFPRCTACSAVGLCALNPVDP
jgi:hypothetical protein